MYMQWFRVVSFLVLTLLVSVQSKSQNAFLDQALLDYLADANEDERIPVAVFLEESVDLASLKSEFDSQEIPAKRRAILVEQALRAQADNSQPELISFINGSGMGSESIERFWIANCITLEAEPQLILDIANRSDVTYLYLNRKSFGYIPKPEKGEGGAKSVGGIEPGLEAIGAPELWAMGYTGHGRIAMTYDTGVWDDHPSHKDRFLANRMPLESTWFAYDSPVPVDKSSSHGTHVTGTILGLDKATNDTIGVAPEAYYIATDPVVSNLAFVKPLTDFMFAYEWSLDPDGNPETTDDIPDVINNSWGFGPDLDEAPCPEFVIPVFAAVEAAGIANVFSAGNEGPNSMTMSVPHNTNIGLVNSFTVAATSTLGNNLVASFSSRGPSLCGGEGSLLIKPEVAAPGLNVRSSIENGEYDNFNGTSMAAPHVSGAVLLLKEAFPDVTGEEVLLALYNSAIDLGEEGEDNTYGKGFIDVMAAYDLLSETNTPTPPATIGTDLDLVRVISPTEDIRCSEGEGVISANLEITNTGVEAVNSFSILYSIVGESTQSFEVSETILPGESIEVNLPELNYVGTGFKEFHARIEVLDGEYDVLNNHAVYRWTELPKYDWAAQGEFSEDFTEGVDENVWTIYNPDAWITWDTLEVLQIDGTTGIAAHMDHPSYLTIASQHDHLISPLIQNRPADINSMAFDYYYRKRSNNDFTKDTLVVFINRSCGDEYMSEEIFRLGGDDLWTNDDSETDALPESADEWATVALDMEFEDTEPFFFSFVSINRRGNNMLVDNVRMGNSLSVNSEKQQEKNVRIYPNPTKEFFQIGTDSTKPLEVSIYDGMGKIILMQLYQPGDFIRTDQLDAGVYLIRVVNEEIATTEKLIIR